MKKNIPNFITLLNLLSGILAILAITHQNLTLATFFVVLGIIFDFFDGFVARLLKVSSPLGLQLDSLADMVTSGVVPGLVMFYMLKGSHFVVLSGNNTLTFLIPYLGLFISLASAYRLAKFNIDTRQTNGFIGLPTPANTLLILSIPLIILYQPNDFLLDLLKNTWFLLGLTILSCYLLNSNIQLFALKFKDFSFQKNKIRYLFLLICLVLLILLKFIAIPLIILIYIIFSFLIMKNK